MLVHERRREVQRRAGAGIDVEGAGDPVDRAVDLGNVALEPERHAGPVARVFEFPGIVEDRARALIVDHDRKALEQLVAHQPREIIETFDSTRKIAQIERRENLRLDDDAADLERIDLGDGDILLALADTRAPERAFGLEA